MTFTPWRYVWPKVKDSYTWLLIGDRGSGKTAMLMLLAEYYESQGYKPMWVFPEALVNSLKDWPHGAISPKRLAETLRDEQKWHVLSGHVIVLDELRILANPRLWTKNQTWVTALSMFMAVARHLDAVILMATQIPGGLDRALRVWSETWVIRRTSLLRWRTEPSGRPTWLITIDKAARLAGRSIERLKADEALVMSHNGAWLVDQIPLPKTWTESKSKYWSSLRGNEVNNHGKRRRVYYQGT